MSDSQPRFSLLRDRVLPLLTLAVMAAALWMTRPGRLVSTPTGVMRTRTCLSNLERIAYAFAHYAQDYDGKFPRGADPEDHHHPTIWLRYDAYQGRYFNDARTAPMLHEILRAYEPDVTVWHCPEDNGWEISRLSNLRGSPLRGVKPSSWARFGTSYYCFTVHGFAGETAADILYPDRTLILFDGDFWHRPEGSASLNGLFADGHTQNLTASRYESLLNDRAEE